MSVVFSIRNKKSMFGYQKVMPAKDVLNLVDGVLTQSFEEAMLGRSFKDFPVLMDSKGDLLKEYGIRSYPSALFIASDGTLAKTHIGYMSKEDIVQTLKEMK